MSESCLEKQFRKKLAILQQNGGGKGKENVITAVKAGENGWGPRYFLEGHGERAFLRMNSNSYLGLSCHPQLLAAEAAAAERYGCGPGAVRFISGTYRPHQQLEKKLAAFHQREAAMVFSAAYAAVLGVLPQIIDDQTLVVSDALNHNSIINAVRLARPAGKAVYAHLNLTELDELLQSGKGRYTRVCVVTDGVFSMRGDYVPLAELQQLCRTHEQDFGRGIITIVDDSHGVGAFGDSGRGTEEITGGQADILIATLGKALGVNGGFVVAGRVIIEFLRETAPLYIYSNSIAPAEAAAALQALEILDSQQGLEMLSRLRLLSERLRTGLRQAGYSVLLGEHPIVPVLIGDTNRTAALVDYLFAEGILTSGLKYPVVPKGEEEIRLQVTAAHTETDIDWLIEVLAGFKMN